MFMMTDRSRGVDFIENGNADLMDLYSSNSECLFCIEFSFSTEYRYFSAKNIMTFQEERLGRTFHISSGNFCEKTIPIN